ncbi:MAG: OB-fold domain-containing protein [Bdellovibrionota bacterium]
MPATALAVKAPARVSIVPYLIVPEKGEPWLLGNRCPKCKAMYLGKRMACSKCSFAGTFEEIRLSNKGKVYVFSVVHQSIPGLRTPYVTAIADLPEGVSVRGSLREIDPNPAKISFDMPVEIFFESAGKDDNGSDVISYYFRPADPKVRSKRLPVMYTPQEIAAFKAAKAAKGGKPAAVAAKAKKPAKSKPAKKKKK